MTLDWYEHPEAREEFLDAHDRYLGIEDGRLGDEFAVVAESAAELILQWPDAPPPYRGQRRDPRPLRDGQYRQHGFRQFGTPRPRR